MTLIPNGSMAQAGPARRRLDIRFPQRGTKDVPQDDEWCELVDGENVTRVRFHDYAQVFSIPGLYDQLFGGPESETKCVSPQVLAGLLREQLPLVLRGRGEPDGLRVLDLGAGNGMMGEEIRSLVAQGYGPVVPTTIVGLDVLPEASEAAERDRPGVYDAYVVVDVTEYVRAAPPPPTDTAGAASLARGFNVLVSASSLAFGDGSVEALVAAASLLEVGGLLVFNLKEDFFGPVGAVVSHGGRMETGGDGFSAMIHEAVDKGYLSIVAKRRYCHRYSVTGEPLYYVAVVAVKHAALP